MAFENVFGNIDFQSQNKMAMAQQQQFADMLGRAIQTQQQNRQLDMQERQLEAKANDFDLKGDAERALMKQNLGFELTPQEQATLATMAQIAPPVYTSDAYGNPIARPSGWSGVGQSVTPQAPPSMSSPSYGSMSELLGNTGQGQGTNPAMTQDYGSIQPLILDDSVAPSGSPMPVGAPLNEGMLDQVSGGYQAPVEFGAKGRLMEEEAKKEVSIAEQKADIQFRKEQMKTDKGREKVTGSIEKTMSDLEKLNDELLAKQAIINNDSSLIDNLKAKYGTSIVGKWTSSVTAPKIDSLRKEYEVKRDSVIPSYIAYFDIPATVVDTEEMQKRILQSFGDPSLSYEVNKAALDNMRTQFNMPKGDTTNQGAQTAPKRRKFNPQTGMIE